MNPDLEKLIELQEIDNQINELKKKCVTKEKEIAALQQKVETAQTTQQAAQDNLDEQQKEHRHLERDLEAKDTTVKKHKTQLMSVKTNREYHALQSEIDEEEKQKDAIEENILMLLDTIDELKSKIKEGREQVKLVDADVAKERGEYQIDIDQLKAELKDKEAQRVELIQGVKKNFLAEYEKLLRKKNGLAIVTASDCTCQGCFISIPPQDYEELKKGNKIYYCSSCSRILYWKIPGVTE